MEQALDVTTQDDIVPSSGKQFTHGRQNNSQEEDIHPKLELSNLQNRKRIKCVTEDASQSALPSSIILNVRRVSACVDRSQMSTLLQSVLAGDEPVILEGFIDNWPSRQWSPAYFGSETDKLHIGDVRTEFAFHPKSTSTSTIPWETKCVYITGSMSEFSQWLAGNGSDGPFVRFNPDEYWGYASYKYCHDLFATFEKDFTETCPWSSLGLCNVDDASATTFWYGSTGATTQCHMDTYGTNLVAQLHGEKHWLLLPPSHTNLLGPTRIPYEESSIFSSRSVHELAICGALKAELKPGELLFVPRHWWHHVEAKSCSISVNTWMPHQLDDRARVSEAVIRVIVSAVLCAVDASVEQHDEREKEKDTLVATPPRRWVNPGEQLDKLDVNLSILGSAIRSFVQTSSSRAQEANVPSVTAERFLNAVCEPNVVNQIVSNLVDAG